MTAKLGYTIFYVDDVGATLDFYTSAFGLERRFLTPENDYGELETGTTTLSFVSNDLAGNNLDAAGGFTALDGDAPPVGASITMVTADVDATVDLAVAAGGRQYVASTKKPWGQTVAYVRDPNGILIEIATAVS